MMDICNQIGKKLFAFQWGLCGVVFNFFLRNKKRELFQSISDLISKDEKLREMRTIRILEIGIAGGSNFEYYPRKSHFVGVDINENFRPQLLNRLKGKDLICERLIYGPAEYLNGIEDNTFDAVISTLVVCSVADPYKVACEVHRVLVDGGKWFMLEHGKYQNSPFHSLLQWLAKPFMKFVGDGCNVDRNISKIVNSVQFKMNHVTYTENKFFGFKLPLIAWYIGTVTK